MPPPATTTRVGGREVEVIIVLPAWPLSVARASAPGTAAAAGKYGRPIAADAHGRADDAGRPRVRPLRGAVAYAFKKAADDEPSCSCRCARLGCTAPTSGRSSGAPRAPSSSATRSTSASSARPWKRRRARGPPQSLWAGLRADPAAHVALLNRAATQP